MKITEIEIKKFRNLSDIKIVFSSGLNAIAG
jgi:predicted ATP-dependent endonuclease of OLD family